MNNYFIIAIYIIFNNIYSFYQIVSKGIRSSQRWAVSPILYYLISLSIIEIIKVSISVSIKAKIVSNIGIYYNRVLN